MYVTQKNALSVTRQEDFAAWYQAAIQEADLAEESGVRGCMIMRPWGYGIWERMQQILDRQIKEAGHENCYFPLFIPLSYFAKEAEHVDGFAKEMAVVTHHRLKMQDGTLVVDPEAKLEEPLVVRPTSETMIGTAFSRWLQSWRDLPIMVNQWANVVRWEMRTRMFLRTTEFLWQEGHTAHENEADAMAETLSILAMYRDFAQGPLAMPVIAGEKPENERFPGAVATYSIEAMMQDGKALQAGTSHYLGQNFAHAQNIRFQDRDGQFQFAHTTSWGVTTRLVGAMIMTHGDDDGVRVPPQVAPHQIVIVPMLRENPEDEALLAYCAKIRAALLDASAFGEPLRVLVDKKAGKPGPKRWGWVKKGAPIILEIGGRDAAGEQVTMLRRDSLYGEDGKLANQAMHWESFVAQAPALLDQIQTLMFCAAKARLDSQVRTDVTDMEQLKAHFEGSKYPGWVAIDWSRPTGAALDAVVEQLKALKLTIRNTPEGSSPAGATCFFTGDPAVERVLLARAY